VPSCAPFYLKIHTAAVERQFEGKKGHRKDLKGQIINIQLMHFSPVSTAEKNGKL
jgi:hypothetical protein